MISRCLSSRAAGWPALGALVVLLVLAGCAAPPVRVDAAADTTWQARRDALLQLDHWRLTGRIGVRAQDDGWNATVDWMQQGDDVYAIEFRGPFGQGAAAVRAAGGVVTMELPERPVTAAADAETLIDAELGWTVPVSGLRYWIRGVPAPDTAARTELDGNGQLLALEQAGWRVEYQRYTPVRHLTLPTKITLTRAALRLRFIIDDWHVDPDGAWPAR